jgi:putative methyltransferase (TIGR04325 family)
MSARTLVKELAPPVLVDLYRRWSGRTLRFSEHPSTFDEAKRLSSSYAAPQILERTLTATRAVTSGQAAFERDSVSFDAPEFSFPILATLLRAGIGNSHTLEVTDFGGSLGNTYRQCRPFLPATMHVRWRVIEQPAFAEAGRREFETDELHFFATLDELPPMSDATVTLASSVLQYLEEPFEVLEQLSQLSAGHMIIDRTPMSDQSRDRLCVQHVPAHIYKASYPCWIFSRRGLLDRLSTRWRLLADYRCPEGAAHTDDGLAFEFRGLILERNP